MHPYVMHLVIDQDQFPFTIIPLLKKKREVAPTRVIFNLLQSVSTFYVPYFWRHTCIKFGVICQLKKHHCIHTTL